ncbi:hypothetical protein C2G38_2234289 [Gigaspora rosea]|uniref:Uncharacterized protein n=1 Tax=Gigaspora rosea TaxID=44941 RepID=A0A397TR38_9GLOM|nr:hypothetical protein C2G38_2234289 [Gigaspora rosea]
MSFLNEQQKPGLLNKLDGILAVPEIKLSDIKVPERIIEKGCPSGTKRLLTALDNCELYALALAIRENKENWNLIKLAINNQLNK